MKNKIALKKDKDLLKELTENQEKLREIKFGLAGSKSRNVKESRNLRKEIARILTELNGRRNK